MSSWYVGAYGSDMEGGAQGVTLLRSRSDGSLEPDSSFSVDLPSPAFLARSHNELFALLEGTNELVVVDIAEQKVTGRVATGGTWPCHLTVLPDSFLVANYFDGSVALIDRGSLRLTGIIGASGSGPHWAQDGPHAHCSIQVDTDVVLTADLGADRIRVHTLVDGRLERTSSYELPAGSGPRDLFQHPSGLLYVLAELSQAILVFDWVDGALQFVDSFGLPGAEETDHAASIALSEDGYLYVGLRGSNRISVLRPSEDGREIERIGSVSSEGDWPRHVVIEGRILHVANQRSSSVASFALGPDGMPILIAEPTQVASPTYLLRA